MTTHALYRFFDDDGALLYVGITLNPASRWAKHADDKPWWHEITRITLETYPSREDVLLAEKQAIVDERPRYNVIHNRGVVAPIAPAAAKTGRVLSQGDVVAIGTDERCPVGLVSQVDDIGVRLDLYSWLTGYFSAGTRIIPWSAVRDVVIASEMTSAGKRDGGYTNDQLVWDMDPLADFQSDWNSR